MSATKNSYDWHCEEHGTYGWRGESCRQCPEAPSKIKSLRAQVAELKADAERIEKRLMLMFEMLVINDTYIQVRNDQDFAIDDIEYDMFSAGWKSAVALVIRTTKGATE